jgi:hypothetical protein
MTGSFNYGQLAGSRQDNAEAVRLLDATAGSFYKKCPILANER